MTLDSPTSRSSGFTLIEMMIALLIFAMLSVAGVVLLRSAVDADELTGQKLRGMAEMQRFVSLLEADLSQALPRTYRNELGDRSAAFDSVSASNGDSFLKLIRGGQSNVNARPKSNLQRVEYRLVDGGIERLHHEMTDGGEAGEPARLIENIDNLRLRFRDKRGQWSDDWRTERLTALPRALEINFDQSGRSYRHVFLVGTGYL